MPVNRVLFTGIFIFSHNICFNWIGQVSCGMANPQSADKIQKFSLLSSYSIEALFHAKKFSRTWYISSKCPSHAQFPSGSIQQDCFPQASRRWMRKWSPWSLSSPFSSMISLKEIQYIKSTSRQIIIVVRNIIAKKRKTGNTDAGFPTTDWKLFSNHVKIYTIVNFVSSQTFW